MRSMLALMIVAVCQLQSADDRSVRAALASIVCEPLTVYRDQHNQWHVLPACIPDDIAQSAYYNQEEPFEQGEIVAIKEDDECYLGLIVALEDPVGDFYRVAYCSKQDLFGPIVNADKLGKFADGDRLNITDLVGG